MPTFKNIRIPKRGGGTRLQRVKVLASGKYKFVKNLVKGKSKSKSSKGSKTKSNPKRKVKRTPKKKNRKRGLQIQRTFFKLIRAACLVAPGLNRGNNIIKAEGTGSAVRAVAEAFTMYGGYKDGKFNLNHFTGAWAPFMMSNLATYGIPKINSMLRRL